MVNVSRKNGVVKKFRYIFLNEVKEADLKVSITSFPTTTKSYQEYLNSDPAVEVFNQYEESVNCEDSSQNKLDSRNRKF